MQGTTILFSEMTPPEGQDAAFHSWYDEEHIPLRMNVPGFVSARRYGIDDTSFLAVYEMNAPTVLASDAYGVVKNQPSDLTRSMLGSVTGFTRYICDEISVRRGAVTAPEALDAPILYAVWFTVPDEACDRFDAWYEQDHIPLLMDCPDWLMVRRFKVRDGEPGNFNRLALHYLADTSALDSPARAAARASDWRAKIAAEDWFKGTYSVFQAVRDRQPGNCAPSA